MDYPLVEVVSDLELAHVNVNGENVSWWWMDYVQEFLAGAGLHNVHYAQLALALQRASKEYRTRHAAEGYPSE